MLVNVRLQSMVTPFYLMGENGESIEHQDIIKLFYTEYLAETDAIKWLHHNIGLSNIEAIESDRK